MVDFKKLNKDAKATEYRIEPLVKMLRSEAISDGGTEKKASELEGKWIRLNETMFAFVEDDKVTVVYSDETEFGCACKAFSDPTMNLLCEHIIAFKNLENKPQISIESTDYRWLQEYLFSLGWYAENRYLYPSLDAPEVVAELPPVDESPKLDPVNWDKPLDLGVGEVPEPKTYERKCAFCGEINAPKSEKGADEWLVWHESICPKNPANKKKPPLVTQDAPLEKPLKTDNTPNNLPRDRAKIVAIGDDRLVEVDDDEEIIRDSATVKKPSKNASNTKSTLIDTIKKYVGNDVLEIFGDTGSGKSKFALEIAREAIDAGLKVFYLDSERNLTDDDVKMLGRGYKYTPVLKEIDTTIQKLPAVDIVIIDSIGFPILTAYARYNMKQKGDALLTMIAMFGDLKQWAYRNNGLVIVVNQPESTFNKEAGHILRPFGDKSQFAAKEIWWLKMVKRADKTSDHHTEILITSFRGRTLGYGDKLYTMNIKSDGIEFKSMR
jgi:RecA/RadA recombinase